MAAGAHDRQQPARLRQWLLALQVIIQAVTPAAEAVRTYATLTAAALAGQPELAGQLQAPEWRTLCEHATVRF